MIPYVPGINHAVHDQPGPPGPHRHCHLHHGHHHLGAWQVGEDQNFTLNHRSLIERECRWNVTVSATSPTVTSLCCPGWLHAGRVALQHVWHERDVPRCRAWPHCHRPLLPFPLPSCSEKVTAACYDLDKGCFSGEKS